MAVTGEATQVRGTEDVGGAAAIALNASVGARALTIEVAEKHGRLGPRGLYALTAIRDTLRAATDPTSTRRIDATDFAGVLRAASGEIGAMSRAATSDPSEEKNVAIAEMRETLALFTSIDFDAGDTGPAILDQERALALAQELTKISFNAASEAARIDRERLVGHAAICF